MMTLIPGMLVLAVAALALWWWLRPPAPLARTTAEALYAAPLAPPAGPLAVYFLGHGLIGRDMPAGLAQRAPAGHHHARQLGRGAEPEAHWKHPDPPPGGFETENAHDRSRPAGAAIDGGTHDARVMTE